MFAQVLLDQRTGILRSGAFDACAWAEDCHPAAMTDVLRVHTWKYVKGVRDACLAAPDTLGTRHLDSDTTVSRGSFRAALKAAGAVCHAIDDVVCGRVRLLRAVCCYLCVHRTSWVGAGGYGGLFGELWHVSGRVRG